MENLTRKIAKIFNLEVALPNVIDTEELVLNATSGEKSIKQECTEPIEQTAAKEGSAERAESKRVRSAKRDKPEEYEECSGRIAFEDKIKMAEKLDQFDVEELETYIRLVRRLCPEAVRKVDESSFQVLVNNIDARSFKGLEEAIDKIMKGKKFKHESCSVFGCA
eukprot:TRINITY_DN8553_c0_g1_i4.p2 TRINITY_DN8553_c0_g1~~TRINITY_DN8553_c0_g1_i4.p2  ORF type:complete len:165 (+),score=54.58 TRINITY_DN8553_c0_g1_i4:69-563(+)